MGKQSTTPIPGRTPRRTSTPLRIALILLLALASHLSAQTNNQTTSVSATAIPLILPSAIVFDPQGNLYLAETGNHVIRKVDPTGIITTIAGNGTQGFSGDAGPATAAQLDSPQGLALDTASNLYIADTHNHCIRKLNLTTNIITTVAGNGTQGFDGDAGPATSAHLNLPTALALDATGNLYLADTNNHRIRKINTTTGIITTIAGNGTQGFAGDTGSATAASIDSPTGIAIDAANNIYLADTHNHRIRRIDSTTGTITTIAGTGIANYSGDNSAALAANLNLPHGLTIDAAGNLYLADTANHRIRRIDATTNTITTAAGDGTQTFSGDTTPAITASLDTPRTTATSPTNLLTLADSGNQRIRQLTAQPAPSTTIDTIAGLGISTPGTLTLTLPNVIAYGTGSITASLITTPATGTITFLDTTNNTTKTLGTATLTTNTAILPTTTLSAGLHNITATYTGDPTHSSAQSPTFTLNITPQPLIATPAPVTILYGQPIPTLTGTVTGILPQDSTSLSTTFTSPVTTTSPANTYAITATITGPAAENYALTTTPANLTIAPAPTSITLTTSATATTPNLPVTLTTHVSSTTSATPTGTITLLDNATPVTTLSISPTGDATYTTSTLPQGSDNITAIYTGTNNFITSTSTTTLITVGTGSGTTGTSDFTVDPTGATSQTVVSGTPASYTFTVQIQGTPLSSPIALSATGLPNLATASFNPAYLPPGATTNPFTLTITTPNTTASNHPHHAPATLALILLPIALLTLRPRKTRPTTKLLALTLTTVALCTGCGDRINTGNLPGLTTKTYTIAVTGTATTPTGTVLQHTATVTLLLQQPN